jgi:hypothetical protein
MAPPAMAMIKTADPVLINRPRPSRAKGHIAGHTRALASHSDAM